ncbi:MAG: nitroreductase family protein [Lentisphaerales bacterium]|nr:MAG: nitroreductase family protein [Lentisphaerales bacterium]
MIKDLLKNTRACRRFKEEVPISHATLRELVDLARISASSGNLQPLKYILSWESAKNSLIFPSLEWAGYLTDWPGPEKGERPAGYIIILGDTTITQSFGCDHGIAAQSIMLGARGNGLGGCILGAVRRKELMRTLKIPACYNILLVLALGAPKETIVLEEAGLGSQINYWRDRDSVHHVPKRSLSEIILEI